MNATDTTNGGYTESAMHKWLMGDATAIVKNAFGSNHLIAHKCLLSTGTYNETYGFGQGWSSDVYLVLPSEAQLGCREFSLEGSTGEAYKTLSIFQNESFVNVLVQSYGQSNSGTFHYENAWLRDICTILPDTHFCTANASGSINHYSASVPRGCFPLAILK